MHRNCCCHTNFHKSKIIYRNKINIRDKSFCFITTTNFIFCYDRVKFAGTANFFRVQESFTRASIIKILWGPCDSVTAKLEVAKDTCSGTSLADSGATRILLILSLLLTGLTTLPHIQHDVRGIV